MLSRDTLSLTALVAAMTIVVILLCLMFYPTSEDMSWVIILVDIVILCAALQFGLLYLSGTINWALTTLTLTILFALIVMVK